MTANQRAGQQGQWGFHLAHRHTGSTRWSHCSSCHLGARHFAGAGRAAAHLAHTAAFRQPQGAHCCCAGHQPENALQQAQGLRSFTGPAGKVNNAPLCGPVFRCSHWLAAPQRDCQDLWWPLTAPGLHRLWLWLNFFPERPVLLQFLPVCRQSVAAMHCQQTRPGALVNHSHACAKRHKNLVCQGLLSPAAGSLVKLEGSVMAGAVSMRGTILLLLSKFLK